MFDGALIREIVAGPPSETYWLAPGLVDIQVNGYAGQDLNDADFDIDTVLMLAQSLQRVGVTTFLPTLITASEDRIVRGLRTIRRARESHPILQRMIPFVHIEGPSLSAEPGPRGAHPQNQVRPPSLAEVMRWQSASGNLVGLVTMSPHWDDSTSFISALTAAGVRVAIGHTHATTQQIGAAVDAGARLSTHLGNGAHGILPRHPNYLWAQLADDRLSASFIADGHHLPADTLKVMLRAKGPERSILVSDTSGLGGRPPGTYEHPIGGTVVLSADGRLGVEGTEYLAGAALPLLAGIQNVVRQTDMSLDQALLMATGNPGRFVGGRGVIAAGAAADLLRFGWDETSHSIQVDTVVVSGQIVVGGST